MKKLVSSRFILFLLIVVFSIFFVVPSSFGFEYRFSNLTGNYSVRFDGVGVSSVYGVSFAVGNLDGDGVMDLAIGISDEDPGGRINAGSVYVINGSSLFINGTYDLNVSAVYSRRYDGSSHGDMLRVGGIGDLDGDGIGDLVIAAPGGDGTSGAISSDVGYVYVINSTSRSLIGNGVYRLGNNSIYSLAENYSRRYEGKNINIAGTGGLGNATAVGDLDGDGRADLAMSSLGTDAESCAGAGMVYVINSTVANLASGVYRLEQPGIAGDNYQPTYRPGGNYSRVYIAKECQGNAYTYLGSSLAIGDLDGDGIGDLIMGATSANNANFRGSVFVINSTATYLINSQNYVVNTTHGGLYSIDHNYSRKYAGASINDNLGGRPGTIDSGQVLTTGDLDGDGVADLIIGAPLADSAGDNAGVVYVINSTATNLLTVGNFHFGNASTYTFLQNYSRRYEDPSSTNFGSVSSGNFSGTTKKDLVVGSINSDSGATNSGSVYIIYSNLSNLVSGIYNLTQGNYTTRYDRDGNTDNLGSAVITGFIDGDTTVDLITAAIGTDFNSRTDSTSIFMLLSTTTVNDTTAPTISISTETSSTCPGVSQTITLTITEPNPSTATLKSKKSGETEEKTICNTPTGCSGTFQEFTTGTYTLTGKATDTKSNTATTTKNIEVTNCGGSGGEPEIPEGSSGGGGGGSGSTPSTTSEGSTGTTSADDSGRIPIGEGETTGTTGTEAGTETGTTEETSQFKKKLLWPIIIAVIVIAAVITYFIKTKKGKGPAYKPQK